MKKKKRGSGKIFVAIALGFFVVALVFLVVGLARTIKEISEVTISKEPSVILASEGVVEGRPVLVSALYRDLNDDDISQGEELFADKKLDSLTEWFTVLSETDPGYYGDIMLDYKNDGAKLSFYKNEFYPLDEATTEAKDKKENVLVDEKNVDEDRHNHLFAMNFGIPITVLASGDEVLEINADDNTLVFVDDKLVIDMDGAGDPVTGVLQIHENGEVYVSVKDEAMTNSGVSVAKGSEPIIKVFHLDKDSSKSVFNMKLMGLSPILSTSNVANDEGGIEVAYDPSRPSHITAKGVGKVFRVSNAKELIILATVEGAALVVFLVVAVSIIKKQKKKRM